MAVFVETTTDPFDDNFRSLASQGRGTPGSQMGMVNRTARRPTRGLEIKEDKPALLKVIQVDGSELPLFDGGSPTRDGRTKNYTNFILQSVTEVRMEKHQIVETFGQSYVFFFGEAPRFIDVAVTLINSHDFNWRAEWWANYEQYFRGTKLVEMGARLYMFYDDNVVEGYMLSAQASEVADQPFLVQMTFRMFLTNYRNVTSIGDSDFPVRGNYVQADLADTDPNDPSSSVTRTADRSKIADNSDEYIGASATGSNTESAQTDHVENQEEVEDLPGSAINHIEAGGGEAGTPQAMSDAGLMPTFPNEGPATYVPQPEETFGPGVTETESTPWSRFSDGAESALGSVYGGGPEATINGRDVLDGGGDREFGHRSDYSNQPGYGGPGYGDLGGEGHGAGSGSDGERGHRSPDTFSYDGVADNQGAFDRFNSPMGSSTVFTGRDTPDKGRTSAGQRVRPDASTSGSAGGAVVKPEGRPSVHSLTSVPGELSECDAKRYNEIRAGQAIDPDRAHVRAVEIVETTGKSFSSAKLLAQGEQLRALAADARRQAGC